jgi:uncharacterized protein (TIGR03435 family)
MTRAFVLFCTAGALFSAAAFGQSTAPQSSASQPTFQLADVHVSPAARNPFLRGPMTLHGLYEIRFATMLDLIRTAYGVEAERVLGGPNWLENDTFDVIAKLPEGITQETAKPLLQALLGDRFHLTVHNDNKPVPAYAIKVGGKHPELKQSDGSGDTGCKLNMPPPPPPSAPGGAPPPAPVFSYACTNMTMAKFAEALTSTIFLAPQYLNDRVVVDETELKGAWDFDLKFTPRGMITPSGPMPGTISLFDALEKLGLKLDPADVPMPVIVVDSVNEKPSANLPDIAEKLQLPPPPTEFEVADLKASGPDVRGGMIQLQRGGRVNIAGIPLKFLVQQAWNVTDDMVVGMPKWMDTDRYDIVAKAPTADVDIDELWMMVRALLVERFKMVTHTEDRPVTAYTLMAVKPKMQKADPNSRTKYKEGPGADGKDPRNKTPILSRLVTCQNMTMAQFSAKLMNIASGYIHSPVLDATGLEGGYDFTLSFSAVGLTRSLPAMGSGPGPPPGPGPGLAGAAPSEAGPIASDPTGAVTLFEAVEKQLGLKLEATKRPVQILVIDHAEQKPTEN